MYGPSGWSNFATNGFRAFGAVAVFLHREVAGARGEPGTGSIGLWVGAWGARTKKKYEIRYRAVRGGAFSRKTSAYFWPEYPYFHIRRWLARMETPAAGFSGSTWEFEVPDPGKNTKSDIRPFRVVHFH